MADLFNISARVGLDTGDFDSAMDSVEKRLQQAIRAFADFTKLSIQSYATYEQLVGGVNALYGEDAGIVFGNAQTAHNRLGMSENDYLQNVMLYTGALLKDLNGDTAEAARYADMAITDLTDNANRFGTAIQSLESAYKGFARETWLMLDNLYLGYSGTKAGAEELLEDAQKLTGKEYDLHKFTDVIDAIHAIQDSMHVTGTTAEEAQTTIEGSIKAVKATYSDFQTAFVDDNKSAAESLEDLAYNTGVAWFNVIPHVQSAMNSLAEIVHNGAYNIARNFYAGATGNSAILYLDREAFGKIVYDSYTEESNRIGVKLSK